MPLRNYAPPDLAGLRARAEQALTEAPMSLAAVSESDALKHWHELQVSQIELGLQNEALTELARQHADAEAAREHYAALYEQAPAAYFSLAPDGRVVRLNQCAATLLGMRAEAVLGQSFERFVAPERQAALRRFLADVFDSGARAALEVALFEGAAGASRVRIEANHDAVAGLCRMIVRDISGADQRDTARRRAYAVLDNIDEAVMVTDAENRIVAVNPAFCRTTGYAAEETLGRDPSFLGRGANPPALHADAWRALRAHGRWQGEVVNTRKDGRRFVAGMSLTAMRNDDGDGAVGHYVGVFSDISARKQAETALQELTRELDARVAARTAELTEANRQLMQEVAERIRAEAALRRSREQLRQLAEHLATVKENERKRIAGEIHDELGQNLLALRIDVSMLRARTGDAHPRLRQRVDAALHNVDTTIRSVRGIMNDLRPSVLDLGLQAALEWQVGEFRKRSGLACRLTMPADVAVAAIPPDVAIVLFRSLQEALSNISRHARASHVDVRLTLRHGDGDVELSVADNGIGVAPEQRAKHQSFGLIGIAERVGALGGRFAIAPYIEGQGCVLTMGFTLPPAGQLAS